MRRSCPRGSLEASVSLEYSNEISCSNLEYDTPILSSHNSTSFHVEPRHYRQGTFSKFTFPIYTE